MTNGLEDSYIISPNYPKKYKSGTDCWWVLRANVGTYIQLKNIDFDVQRLTDKDCIDNDDLRIYDFDEGLNTFMEIGSYCNTIHPFKGYLSTGHALKIHFTSKCSACESKGFKFRYSSITPG